jgi:hypothetical protein
VFLGIAVLVPLIGPAVAPDRCNGSEGAAAALAAGAVGWSQPQLVLLPAATRVGESPPTGWSHLVIRSIPRLASGDRDTLPSFAFTTATLFRTVILADVQPVGLDKEFILARVGLGMCVPGRDGPKEDIVVASDRLEALSVRLSTIERKVLDVAEAELAEARIVSRTSTFALLRAPATLVVAGKHRKVDLCYAFCVDRMSGRLRVGVWSMWPGTNRQPPPPLIIELAPKTSFDCALDVHAVRLLGTIPFNWSFALRELPPGREVRVAGPLGDMIATVCRHAGEVKSEELERLLKSALFPKPEAIKAGYQTMSAPPHQASDK